MTKNGPRRVRVALMGLGKLGLKVAAGLVGREDIEVVAALDLDPEKAGADLGELVGSDRTGVLVAAELSGDVWAADLAIVMTSSRMDELFDTIVGLLEGGLDVLTSAEEMAYPWHEFPEESRKLDKLAREQGRTVLGAGANPGFLMDVVPVILSLATQGVNHLKITRAIDLRFHGAGRLERFALGETVERFEQLPQSIAHGHIGFRQSIDAVADALELSVSCVEELPLRPTVLAAEPRAGELVTINSGCIAVVSQGAVGFDGEQEVIRLEEHFGFHDEDDGVPHGDTYVVNGEDQQFTVAIRPGAVTVVTTPAVLVNMVLPVVRAAPGLRSMIDFPVRELASKGANRSLTMGAASGT